MKKTLISVIMPAWNAGLTIADSVRSVLQQTYANLELLIVDDGSQDDTLEVLSAIKDERLSLRSTPHQDVSAARNHGIRHSTGDFLSFIDADDLWLEQKLEAQLKALQSNPRTSVAYGLLDRIDETGGQRLPHTRAVHSGDVLETLLVWNFVGNGSNLLVTREAVDSIGGFDESLESAEDWEYSVRLARKFSFVCVPEVVGLYRQSRHSSSAQLSKMERGYRKAIRLVYGKPDSPDRLLRRKGLAVHYHYLACKALQRNHSVGDALSCSRYLFYCLIYSMSAGGIYRRLGLFPHFLRSSMRLLRPRKAPEKWTIGDEYHYTGLVREAQPLADPLVVPDLIADSAVFEEAIAELRASGHQYRVPYIITDAIRRVAFDPNITHRVSQILGKDVPWVMWGANIRKNVPNDANLWHSDTESIHWNSITVVVGLNGCEKGNASKYIPYSQLIDRGPPGELGYSDKDKIIQTARRLNPACQRIESFSNFQDGSFYAFNAKGWHCGDPVTSEGRLMLFMHYQRAADKRVPYMENYVENTWFDKAAPYLSCFEREGLGRTSSRGVNEQVHSPPKRAKRKRNRLLAALRKLWKRRAS